MINAHADGSENKFAFGCRHNSCCKKSSMQFVKAAVEQGWLAREDLTNESFLCVTNEDVFVDRTEVASRLSAEISTLDCNKTDYGEKIVAILTEAIEAGLTLVKLDQLKSEINKTGAIKRATLDDQIKAIKKAREKATPIFERMRKAVIDSGAPVPLGRPVVILRQGIWRQRAVGANRERSQ